jgi:integrase
MILSEPCQNSVLDAPERGMVRKRIRFQDPKPKLRKVGRNWVWYGQWRDADGRKRGKVLGPKSKMTESQAKAALQTIVHPINSGIAHRTKPVYSFGRYVKDVFIPVKQRRWKEGSTDVTTIQQINCHLVPEIGESLLSVIQREDLQALLDRKALRLSKSVVGHLRWALNSVFKLALSDGLISNNPAAALIVPRKCKPGRPTRSLTLEEIDTYLSALALRERAAARLAVFEGMRPGEILALRWRHVSGGHVQIDERVYRGKFDLPKGGEERVGGMSVGTPQLLAELRKVSVDPGPDGFVFASEAINTPISRDNLWRRCMKPALAKVGLEWATFRVLRTTNGSQGKKQGSDPKVMADQRGHDLGVSMKVYTRSDLEQMTKAVRKFESAVVRKQRQKQSA